MVGISYLLLLIADGMLILDFFTHPIGVISDTTLFQCTVIGTLGLVLEFILSKYNRRALKLVY